MESVYTGKLRERQTKTVALDSAPLPPKGPAKTGSERFKKFYEALKNDPERYQEYLRQKREDSKKNLLAAARNDTDADKERKREATRLRVQKYRLKKKLNPQPDTEKKAPLKPLTRADREKKELLLQKDRDRKKAARAGWSRQKKKAEAEKAKMNRSKRKEKELEEKRRKQTTCSTAEGPDRTRKARAKALQRARAALPKDPNAAKETATDLYEKVVAKARKQELNAAVKELTKDRKVTRRVLKRLNSCDQRTKQCGIKLLGLSKQRCYSLQKSLSFTTDSLRKSKDDGRRALVEKFLTTNARISPDVKSVTKYGPRFILEDTMEALFQRFKTDNPGIKIGRSFFHNCRPRNVKTAASTPINQCLCEVCTNIDLRIDCLSPHVPNLPTSKQTLLREIMCKTESPHGHFKRECLEIKCENCGPHLVDTFFETVSMDKTVCLKQWKHKVVDGQKRKTVVSEDIKLGDVLATLKSEMSTYAMHSFFAKWQYQQFSIKKDNLEDGELLMVLDFAENYRCEHQDEVQSAHWGYSQITVHPIVCYHRCNVCPGMTVTHSVVVVSNDNCHDPYAVHTFLRKAYALFNTSMGDQIKVIHHWSDGCPTQYKSKTAFYMFQGQGEAGKQKVWNFFGSRHGKNPSDGESAVVKSAARRAVKMRKAEIQSSRQMVDFAVANLSKCTSTDGVCNHFRRSFIHVDSSEIERPKLPNLKRIDGTRSIHSVMAEDNTQVAYRNLTCYCVGCTAGMDCDVGEYVDAWRRHSYPIKQAPQNLDTVEMEELSTSALNYLESLNDVPADALEEHTVTQPSEPQLDSQLPLSPIHNDPADAHEEHSAVPPEHTVVPPEHTVVPPEHTVVPPPEPPLNSQLPLSPIKNCPHVQTGSWVVANFPGKAPSAGKKYLGLVLAVDSGEANVKFCRQSGRHFTWPHIDDIGWMPTYALTIIEAPSMDVRERMLISEAAMALF